jgi:hypothetical protein
VKLSMGSVQLSNNIKPIAWGFMRVFAVLPLFS